MSNAKKQLSVNIWADVVIAMLSVNNYSLDKTFKLFSQLEENGLFNPQNLASWDHSEIFIKLEDSGYKRGDVLICLLAGRLQSLGSLAENQVENENILVNGNKDQVADLLSRVKGIGPVVLSNFLGLRGK